MDICLSRLLIKFPGSGEGNISPKARLSVPERMLATNENGYSVLHELKQSNNKSSDDEPANAGMDGS